jgi:Lipase (class 3)
MPAPTITEGRLICACNCAYDIMVSGPLPTDPAELLYIGAGFTQTPKAFVAGPDDIDACLVATTPDGVVLAFRGTLTFDIHDLQSLRDWVNNFVAKPVKPDWLPDDSPVRVHEGFLTALENLRQIGALDEVANQLQAAGPAAKLVITGHSKGGAVAMLAALRFRSTNGLTSQLVTFAAPRAGDPAFADIYNNGGIQHTRYEFHNDLVPHMPPRIDGIVEQLAKIPWISDWFADVKTYDYESVGVLRFIDWSNQLQADSRPLEQQRDWNLAKVVVSGQFTQFNSDHEIRCKAAVGYMSVVGPGGVCP